MPIGEICVREVVVARRDTTVQEAAHLMRHHHVGNLLVVERNNGSGSVPVGIVTDRDITISVVATRLDPAVFTLGDLLTGDLVAADEEQGIFETIQQMRQKGVRRMPVVNREGGLVGIVSLDDMVQLLADEMNELAKLVSNEQVREARTKQ